MQNLSLEEMEDIEAKVDKLGVSSLVAKLGGFGGTYPTFVATNASLRFTLDTVTEEWLHQYLVFKPLGFLYLLDLAGVSRNYDIATMNETVAGMVSKEIGTLVCEKYYPQWKSGDRQPQEGESEFDFNREMREIRRAVDGYLAQGEIEQAEEFMEQRRQFLLSKGYYIRKLNQAYFAFHGTYADSPTSIHGWQVNHIIDQEREWLSMKRSKSRWLKSAIELPCRNFYQASLRTRYQYYYPRFRTPSTIYLTLSAFQMSSATCVMLPWLSLTGEASTLTSLCLPLPSSWLS